MASGQRCSVRQDLRTRRNWGTVRLAIFTRANDALESQCPHSPIHVIDAKTVQVVDAVPAGVYVYDVTTNPRGSQFAL